MAKGQIMKSTSIKSLRTPRGPDAENPSVSFHVSGGAQSRNHNSIALQASPSVVNLTRPSTSAGPVSQKQTCQSAHRRGSCDALDLPFKPRVSRLDPDFPSSPCPAALLTPDAPPSSRPRDSLTRRRSLDIAHAVDLVMNDGLAIGMALGSPSHPDWNHPSNEIRDSATSGFPPESSQGTSTKSHPKQQKNSKWKALGGLFGKKSTPSPSTFYQLQHSEPPEAAAYDSGASLESQENIPGRARASSDNKVQQKPPVKRAYTAPAPKSDHLVPVPPTAGASLLDFQIPDVRLERYSVMFGSVLTPNLQSSDSSSRSSPASSPRPGFQKSSLLSRRQANLDNLMTVDESVDGPEQEIVLSRPRRITSPHFTKTPPQLFPSTPAHATKNALSLFPSTPPSERRDSMAPGSKAVRSCRRSRSYTSPAVPSPVRSNFASKPLHNEASPSQRPSQLGGLKQREEGLGLVLAQPDSHEPTALRSHETSHLEGVSPGVSCLPSPQKHVVNVVPTSNQEPSDWEISPTIHFKPASKSETTASSASHSASTSQASQSTNFTTPTTSPTTYSAPSFPTASIANSPRSPKNEEALKSAVEFSIARQICVSQSQRQLLNRVAQRQPPASSMPVISITPPPRKPASDTSVTGNSPPSKPAATFSVPEEPKKSVGAADRRSPLARSPSCSSRRNCPSPPASTSGNRVISPNPISPLDDATTTANFKVPVSKFSAPRNAGPKIGITTKIGGDSASLNSSPLASIPPTRPTVSRTPSAAAALQKKKTGVGITLLNTRGAMEDGMRIMERKVSTPIVVTPAIEGDERNGLAIQGAKLGHRYQKSENAVIESA